MMYHGGAQGENLRDWVPVAESDVCTAFVTALKLVQEETKLGLSGDASALDIGVDRQIVV